VWVLATVALIGVGCSDSSGGGGVQAPTLVAVSPEYFLGDAPCVQEGPGLIRYSATVLDVTDDPDGFELQSSGLVSCLRGVAFSFVVPEHRYIAEIRGYDRSDLKPESAGSPNAVDPEGRVVRARYSTRCGYRSDPSGEGGAGSEGIFELNGVRSVENFTVYTNYCEPLADSTE
jgi:hypothetical protein